MSAMETEMPTDKERWLSDLKTKAEAFRVAMVQSGALDKVGQGSYIKELRDLECALNPMNYRDER